MAKEFAKILSNNYSVEYIGRFQLLSQDIANNKSKIRLYGIFNNKYNTTSAGSEVSKAEFLLNGTAIKTGYYRYYPGETELGTVDIEVKHNSDGSFPDTEVEIYAYSYHFNKQSAKGKITSADIPDIPRNSTFGTITGNTIGGVMMVNINRAVSTFTHQLWYRVGKSKWYDIGNNVGTSISFIVAEETATQFPNDKKGEIELCLRTFNGHTQIGSDVYKKFDIYIPENNKTKPIISMKLLPKSDLPNGFDGIYLQGKTKVFADFSESYGVYDATIKKYELTVNGKTTEGAENISDLLYLPGEVVVKGKITDSRGFTNEITEKILVIEYAPPYIIPFSHLAEIICCRCDKNGESTPTGTYLLIRAGRKYSPVIINEEQKNRCSLQYRYRVRNGEFSSWTTLIDYNEENSDFIETKENIVLDISKSYDVQLLAVDNITVETEPINFSISTAKALLNFRPDGNGAKFGGYAEEEGVLDIPWRVKVEGFYLDEYILKTIQSQTE